MGLANISWVKIHRMRLQKHTNAAITLKRVGQTIAALRVGGNAAAIQ
jgi:hypothetical protein